MFVFSEWKSAGHDVVLVVGAEQQKTMSALDGSDVLGAAADYHNEKPEYGDFMPRATSSRSTY